MGEKNKVGEKNSTHWKVFKVATTATKQVVGVHLKNLQWWCSKLPVKE